MENIYKKIGRNSNVAKYSIGINSITVQFKDGSVYLYDYAHTTFASVEPMKRFAQIGRG